MRSIPSDHAAVRVVLPKATIRGHQGKRIQSWMSKHPVFYSVLKQINDDHQYPCPFGALADFKLSSKKRELSRTVKHVTAYGPSYSLVRPRYERIETGTSARQCDLVKRGSLW